MLRRRYLALVVFFAMLSTLFPLAREAAAVSTGVVISQVYGGGGNSGATLKNDFIELFNRGSAAIDVSAWSVQYASMLGTSWQRTNLSGSIAPGQYYLVQEAAGAGGTTNLPTPDATGTIAMSATAAKVAPRSRAVRPARPAASSISSVTAERTASRARGRRQRLAIRLPLSAPAMAASTQTTTPRTSPRPRHRRGTARRRSGTAPTLRRR